MLIVFMFINLRYSLEVHEILAASNFYLLGHDTHTLLASSSNSLKFY